MTAIFLRGMAFHTVFALLLYVWQVHGVTGARNLLMLQATLMVFGAASVAGNVSKVAAEHVRKYPQVPPAFYVHADMLVLLTLALGCVWLGAWWPAAGATMFAGARLLVRDKVRALRASGDPPDKYPTP